jgi:hypothetical protein
MIRKISDLSRKHPFTSLFGVAFVLNLYIQGMSWHINNINDPMARQFNQNIFICMLGAVVAIAAIGFIFICQAPSPTFNPEDLTERERVLRGLLFNVIVPLAMAAVIIGDFLIVVSLKW